MNEDAHEVLSDALDGRPAAVRRLIRTLTPVIQTRVARALLRWRGSARGRDVRQEVEDLTQEVFVALFSEGGKRLRAWDPGRGMSLNGFVGLIAEQQVAAVLRSGKRSPWKEDPTLDTSLDLLDEGQQTPEALTHSRDLLAKLLEALRQELSPLGLQLFQRLLVEQRQVREICEELSMTEDAVYAWRSRLRRLARTLAAQVLEDPVRPALEALS